MTCGGQGCRAPTAKAATRGGGNRILGQVQAGPVFIFRAQHRLFAHQKVLEDFTPTHAEMSFQKVGAAANNRAQGATTLHLPMDVAGNRPSPIEEVAPR